VPASVKQLGDHEPNAEGRDDRRQRVVADHFFGLLGPTLALIAHAPVTAIERIHALLESGLHLVSRLTGAIAHAILTLLTDRLHEVANVAAQLREIRLYRLELGVVVFFARLCHVDTS